MVGSLSSLWTRTAQICWTTTSQNLGYLLSPVPTSPSATYDVPTECYLFVKQGSRNRGDRNRLYAYHGRVRFGEQPLSDLGEEENAFTHFKLRRTGFYRLSVLISRIFAA